jgi:L-amino acid N-acyltransferase YncA
MPEIRIRRARAQDAATIARNNRAMARETEDRHLDEDTVQTGVNEALASSRHGFYLLAERSGRVVGQTLITFEWSDWRNADFWWLQSVYVDPNERKSGVFKALYRQVLKEAEKDPKVCGLRLYVHRENRRARSVYLSLGMDQAQYEMFEVNFSG